MSEHYDHTALRDLIAVAGDAPDVRAALDASGALATPEVLPGLKDEVDRLAYADRARAGRLVEAAGWCADRLGDPVSRAFADAAEARVRYAESRYRDAVTLYDRAGEALLNAGRPVDAAAVARQRLVALMYLGRYDEASEAARDARKVLRAAGAKRLLGELEFNVGLLNYSMDRTRAALASYERAAVLLEDSADARTRAFLDHNRALALYELDRFDEALVLYERARASFLESGDAMSAARMELSIAYVEFLKGHYHEALRRFRAGQAAGEGVFNEADFAFTDMDLADVYLRLNALAEAEAAAARACERFQAAGMSRDLGAAQRLAAAAALRSGDAAGAVRRFSEVADTFDASRLPVQAAVARVSLAEALILCGEHVEARRVAADAAHALGSARHKTRRRRARIVEAWAAFGAGDARAAAQIARATLRSAADRDDWAVYQCSHLLGDIEAGLGRPSSALTSYRRAIDAIERLRSRIVATDYRSSFLEDKLGLYESAVRLFLDAGTEGAADEAFRTLELAKARTLADLLTQYAREAPRGGEDDPGREVRDRFARLVDELAWTSAKGERVEGQDGERYASESPRRLRELRALEARVALAYRDLQDADPKLADLYNPKPAGTADIRALLSEGEKFVEYVVASGEISAIVVTKDGVRAVQRFANMRDVDAVLERLGFQLESFVYGRAFARRREHALRRSADACLSELYDMLLRPLEEVLGDDDLVVVPHGRLHYVPFHALRDETGYVVERRAVSYALSATTYALSARVPRTIGDRVLVCGIADERAPEIAREVEQIRRLFPSATVLSGNDATRAAFAHAVADHDIVHLATHARYRSDNPLLSGLRLADAEMTFYDVFGLSFGSPLVVLSGCNTGTVAVGAGDELQGLMRGFFHAGAPSLVVSMWAADDSATAALMGDFYGALRSGATARDALARAQRAAIARDPHPYYWASFVLYGRVT